jgi:hypothetical protein
MKKTIGALSLITALGLSGCSMIPSFDPVDQEANRAACESISSSWGTFQESVASADLFQLAGALVTFSPQVDQALNQTTDQQLRESLTQLKATAETVATGGELQPASLASAVVGISARCAVLGTVVDLQVPPLLG